MTRTVTLRRSTRALCLAGALCAASAADAAKEKAPVDAAATRAEIQVALCADPDAVVRALDLEARGDPRKTWLFDDASLSLFERGLRFRVRATDSGTELTLKAAVDDCANVPRELIPPKVGKCEQDLHGGKVTAAVSLTTRLYQSVADRLLNGRLPLADALSEPQLRYLREATKAMPLPSDLRLLGPIEVRSYRSRAKPYDVDVSRLPNGERYVEISRKVPVADVDAARKQLDDDLARGGVAVCADQSAQAVNKLRTLLRAP